MPDWLGHETKVSDVEQLVTKPLPVQTRCEGQLATEVRVVVSHLGAQSMSRRKGSPDLVPRA